MKATNISGGGASTGLAVADVGTKGVYLYCETLGPSGLVRADCWEDAFSAAVDELMQEADPEYLRELMEDAGPGELPECHHHRSCGGIASEDPNGSQLFGPLDLTQIDDTTFEAVCRVVPAGLYRVRIELESDDFDFDPTAFDD